MRQVSIHQRSEDEWYWVFTDSADQTTLQSNLTYESFYAAGRAAARAYPGVAVVAADATAVPRAVRGRASDKQEHGRFARKAGSILAPVVVLWAWSRARRPR